MTEQQIEDDLISQLVDLKYVYRPDIRDRASLEANFRTKFEELNKVRLSDNEFGRLLENMVTPDVFTAAHRLRHINSLERDDGSQLNFTLVNIKDWCKNTFEVVNQLRINTDYSHHRYDVLILLNGVPVVHIELKTLSVSPRRAMQQIVDYKTDPGNGYTKTLLCFIQLFIVSNHTDTWYFANNNNRHFSFNADERFLPVYQFASEDNKKIVHLDDFADTFLAKCTLGEMISRYMVLVASEQKLMMMRPYQIYAVQAIVDCIHHNCGHGYIWHTTGSGKTLTSFKASILLKDNPDIEKCLFVVDRKDLDRQTREEFNRFQKGCVEENTNTENLVTRLLSTDYSDKVIVTTIQKLGLALDGTNKRNYKERLEPLKNKRIVFIFDECHRSQFGENHKAIKEFFPKAQLFGFTGTPIFEANAQYQQIVGQVASYRTTEELFERCLHQYTITHAIEDKNVLRFRVDYFKPEGQNLPEPGEALAKEKVVETILEKHRAVTGGRKFNALLATSSINDAIEYYQTFQRVQNEKSNQKDFNPLNIACVFSPPAEGNKDIKQIQEDLPQEQLDNQQNPSAKKKALGDIITGYNQCFGTSHRPEEFDLYYQDIQKRIKDQRFSNKDLPQEQKIDVTIVVDMLLTGFDSKYLNTLYVDKNLKYHGLIQAFSRTNRILNDTKPYGNILDFRQQQDSVEKAITLFSGETVDNPREIWLAEDASKVITKFEQATQRLAEFMHSHDLENDPSQVRNLKGDQAKSHFINLFKEVQRLTTQLSQYTDLSDQQKEQIATLAPPDQLQGFRGMYLEIAKELKEFQDKPGDKDSPVEELDFEFVLFASSIIDYDYIMDLLTKMSAQPPAQQHISKQDLVGLIQSEAKLMDECEDITEFVYSLDTTKPITLAEVHADYETFKQEKKTREIMELAQKHGLKIDALQGFIDNVLQFRIFDGEAFTELMIPLGLGWKARVQAERDLMQELAPLLRRQAKGRDISGLRAYEQ